MKLGTYGLSALEVKNAKEKLENGKKYLDKFFIKLNNGKMCKMSQFAKNFYHNADKYIAEIQHRVWTMHNHAKMDNYFNIFLTLTLPGTYHKTKIKKLNSKQVLVRNKGYDKVNDKLSTGDLTKLLNADFTKLRQLRAFRNIPVDKRYYFKVIEPHQSGTPHMHVSIYVAPEYYEALIKAILSTFKTPKCVLKVDEIKSLKKDTLEEIKSQFKEPKENSYYIRSSIHYLMKYILKTFDDFRSQKEPTNLTLWYLAHSIRRFSTSRSFIALKVYRAFNGLFTLGELTYMKKDKELSVYVDPDTGKVLQIYRDGFQIFNYKHYEVFKPRKEDLEEVKDAYTLSRIIRFKHEIKKLLSFSNQEQSKIKSKPKEEERKDKNILFYRELDEYGELQSIKEMIDLDGYTSEELLEKYGIVNHGNNGTITLETYKKSPLPSLTKPIKHMKFQEQLDYKNKLLQVLDNPFLEDDEIEQLYKKIEIFNRYCYPELIINYEIQNMNEILDFVEEQTMLELFP